MSVAFEERLGRHLDELHATALCFTGNEAEAESLLFEAVRTAFHRFRAGGDPSDWRLELLQILTRTHQDRERRAGTAGTHRPARPRSAARDPAAGELQDLEQAVGRAIAELEPEPRMALWLVNVLGLRYRQAAACLQWPVERVRVSLAVARRGVRNRIDPNLRRRLEEAT